MSHFLIVMLNVVMLGVLTLRVVIPSVVAPMKCRGTTYDGGTKSGIFVESFYGRNFKVVI